MRVKLFSIISIIAVFLTACGLGSQGTPTAVQTSTPIPPPTLTATPVLPLAILVMPSDLDKSISDAYQKVVYDLAQGSGLRFQVRNTFTKTDIEPGLQVVVVLPPDPGIAELAAAAPKVQFLAINLPGVTAGGNISALATSSRADVPAFIAGYTAAMISDDYHSGMLVPDGNTDAQRAMAAFANGASYYCGLCQPFYYVPFSYPQFQAIPAGEDKTHFPAYANILLNDRKVYTLYLYPDIAIKELTDYLGTTGTQVIGTVLPNPTPAGWVMTIRPDETKAIQNAWADLVAGKGGQDILSPLGLRDVNPTLLSPGKERLVQQVLDDLQAGRIATGAAP